MRLKELMAELDALSPLELQEDWDNSGLLVGHPDREVETALVSLDIDPELIDAAPENSVIIAHHPLIFGKMNRLDFSTYPAILLEKMVKKNISHIAMHTNFDRTHLNRYVTQEVLGFEHAECEGFYCRAAIEGTFDEVLNWVCERLELTTPKTVRCHDRIRSMAVTTGSGASLMDGVEADLFLTGDIKYHDAMKARTLGLSMIDISHYESERHFAPLMAGLLKNLPIQAIIADSKNPFTP